MSKSRKDIPAKAIEDICQNLHDDIFRDSFLSQIFQATPVKLESLSSKEINNLSLEQIDAIMGYNPYVPLQITKSLMSRYATKKVNPEFYGTITINRTIEP